MASTARSSWLFRIAAGQFPLLAALAWPVAFVGLFTEGWVLVRTAFGMFFLSVAGASLANGVVMLRPLAGARHVSDADRAAAGVSAVVALCLLALGALTLAGFVYVLQYE